MGLYVEEDSEALAELLDAEEIHKPQPRSAKPG